MKRTETQDEEEMKSFATFIKNKFSVKAIISTSLGVGGCGYHIVSLSGTKATRRPRRPPPPPNDDDGDYPGETRWWSEVPVVRQSHFATG